MRFSDFVTLQRGFDLPKTEMRDGPYPVVGSTSIIGRHDAFRVEPPGVVTGRSGSLGVVQYIAKKFWPHNTSLWVKDFKGNDPKFVYYCMQGIDFARFNAGAGVPTLNRNHLDSLEVEVPSIPVQRRIAGILSAYDELIENNQRRIRILEEMARSLYREWFVHFRYPGHESVPLIDTPLGQIPQGWEVKSLADLMEIRGGSQPPKSEFKYAEQEGYVRLIQIRDYESDTHQTFVQNSSRLRLCERGDIMIARYGASVARICSGLAGAYNVALAKVIPTAKSCKEFLRQFLMDDEFQKQLIGMSGRAAQNGFNKSDIAAIRVVCPCDSDLFEKFECMAVPLFNSILEFRDQIENLRHTRDLLLPRLLSGKVELLPEEVS